MPANQHGPLQGLRLGGNDPPMSISPCFHCIYLLPITVYCPEAGMCGRTSVSVWVCFVWWLAWPGGAWWRRALIMTLGLIICGPHGQSRRPTTHQLTPCPTTTPSLTAPQPPIVRLRLNLQLFFFLSCFLCLFVCPLSLFSCACLVCCRCAAELAAVSDAARQQLDEFAKSPRSRSGSQSSYFRACA
jgi:hypothetical protein